MIELSTSPLLFQPDLFSAREPRFIPLSDSALREKTLLILNDFYALDPSDIQDFKTPEIPCLNSFVVRISTSGEEYILKGMPAQENRLLSAEACEARLQLITDLRQEREIPLPEIFPNIENALSFQSGDFFYYLMRYESGQYAGSSPGNQDFIASAAAAGKLIDALRKSACPEALPERRYFDEADNAAIQSLKCLASEERLHPRVSPYWPAFCRHFEIALRELKNLDAEGNQPELGHFDLHPQNFLLRDSKVVCFLDLESILPARRIACLGFFVFKLIRHHIALSGLAREEVSRLRDNLVERLIEAGALDPSEARRLAFGARLENLKRFLHGFRGKKEEEMQGGPRMPIFGNAFSGEIDYVFDANAE